VDHAANPAPPVVTVSRWRRWLAAGRGRWLGVAVSSAFAGALLLIPDPGPLPPMRFGAFDFYQTHWPRVRTSAPAVIVAIDEKSLARVGQWPWSRDTMAQLFTRLAARAPAAIGVDILFAEPDRVSPDRLAEAFRMRDPLVADRLAKMRPNDALLAESIKNAPVVLGVADTDLPVSGNFPRAPSRQTGPAPPLHKFKVELRSLPEIDRAAAGHGFLNAEPDRGVVRRVLLAALFGANPDPLLALSMECLRVAAGETFFTLESDARGLRQISIGDAAVPTQADGSLWVHYSPPDRDRYVSAVDVLEGRDDPALIAQKIALLGVTGLGLVDQQVTSRGDRMPGIEIHAQVLENIFENSWLRRPAWARLAEALAFALLAAIIIIGVPRVPPRRSVAIPVVCWTLVAASGLGAYYWGRLLFDPATLIWGINLLYGIMVSATLVAIDLERRDLAARLATEREAAARVAGELGAAHRIQTRMLPNPATVLASERRIEIYADMRPAREVGGDLYDFFPLADDRLFLLVGDVAGKGLPAAMFMAVSKALAKSSTLHEAIGLENLMTVVNTEISRDNPEDLFVTLIALIIDLKTGRFDYCNAGHEPPLLIGRDGRIRILNDGGGPPICVMADFPYEIASAACEPGDLIVLTSDGITEAMDPEGRLYGRDRLQMLLRSPALFASEVDAIGRALLADVQTFEAGAEPADDQTLLIVRWRGERQANGR
jgi:serine phosphatase RsbU (regulator of sigma subunit)/CHASE2 domain-containing sensor protein